MHLARVAGRSLLSQRAGVRAMSGQSQQPEQEKLPSGGKKAEELRGTCCGKCSPETPTLSREEIDENLKALPMWKLQENGKAIERKFVAKNFTYAIDFFNHVKDVAESEGHHPDLHLERYRDVTVVLSTHAAGGLTLNDMIVAAKLDNLPVTYSPKWLRQQTGQE